MTGRRWRFAFPVLAIPVLLLLLTPSQARAQTPPVADPLASPLDLPWVLLCTAVALLVQAGLGCLACGLTRAKNAAHIFLKLFLNFCIASLSFWAFGHALAFGQGTPLIGLSGWFLAPDAATTAPAPPLPLEAHALFHIVLASLPGTIALAALAERITLRATVAISLVMNLLIYPLAARAVWGGGLLAALGMRDYAGGAIIHTLGAAVGLVGAWIVGPRLGRYAPDGRPRPLAGHSLTLAALGVALALVGWLALLAGAPLALNPDLAARALLSAVLAAAAGFLTAVTLSWLLFTRPDASVGFNGLVGGLVAISAPCGYVSPLSAALIGLLGGIAVIVAIQIHDHTRIDDPVGVIAVHGACGSLGTIALGLFAQAELAPPQASAPSGLLFGGGPELLVDQLVGLAALSFPTLILSALLFALLRVSGSLRATPDAEIAGLDLAELATDAYPDFQATVHPVPSLDSLKPVPKRPLNTPPRAGR